MCVQYCQSVYSAARDASDIITDTMLIHVEVNSKSVADTTSLRPEALALAMKNGLTWSASQATKVDRRQRGAAPRRTLAYLCECVLEARHARISQRATGCRVGCGFVHSSWTVRWLCPWPWCVTLGCSVPARQVSRDATVASHSRGGHNAGVAYVRA